MTLGTYGQYTVDQARKLARKHLVAIDGGADPLEARQKDAQGETIKDLCSAYIERHAKPHKRSWRDDQRRIDTHLLPAWGNRKAKSITGTDAAALHSKIGKIAPYEANRTLALISKMFELARRWGFVAKDHANPARDIDRFKEHKRDRRMYLRFVLTFIAYGTDIVEVRIPAYAARRSLSLPARGW